MSQQVAVVGALALPVHLGQEIVVGQPEGRADPIVLVVRRQGPGHEGRGLLDGDGRAVVRLEVLLAQPHEPSVQPVDLAALLVDRMEARPGALVQLEDYPGIMGGIASGRIAAGALADPFTMHAAKLGYKEIANMANLGLEFPFVGVVTKKTFVRDNPDTVQRFVRAYTEAISIYKNNKEFAMKVTGKYTGIKDPAILGSTVDFYVPKLSAVPYPTIGGMRFVLEQIAVRDPRAKSVNAESFMDTRFVKNLEDSGFIQSLYPKR